MGEPIHFSDANLQDADRNAYAAISQRIMDAIAGIRLPEAKVDLVDAANNDSSHHHVAPVTSTSMIPR